jgi:3-methyladenine DNA glycosylase AlkD
MNYIDLIEELKKYEDSVKADHSKRFFKTGIGEYAEGDQFFGLTNPQVYAVVKKFRDLPIGEVKKIIKSPVHEVRMSSLQLLIWNFYKGDEKTKNDIYNFYLANTRYVNNWDLVDLTAPHIVGKYLIDKPRDILYKLAKSTLLWDRRISIIATFSLIRNNEYHDTLTISEILLTDKHDLIHKAVGWMLREVGKRDLQTEETFIKKHYKFIPRTSLRYAIEKFPEGKRKLYLSGTF